MEPFADSSSLLPELLRMRGTRPLERGAHTITELHRLLLGAAMPYIDRFRRSRPQDALDTTARAILGACFHNSSDPIPPSAKQPRAGTRTSSQTWPSPTPHSRPAPRAEI
ncbi:hypothetical protein [Streptomyces sp. NPDC058623]|uniref:hypothetical protein n=1 Tax=Streptomyces sp. NPDC058623 TaxID=3346563 RepID=UPI003648BAFB